MKTTVGFLRNCIKGLRNETNIELKDGMICIVPAPQINFLDRPNYLIDKKAVLAMAKDGKKQVEIAEHFKVTRQAINLIFKKLRQTGEL